MSIQSDLVTLNSSITQLMRAIRRIDERQGIARARLSALAVLQFAGSCTLSELARREMVSRATMHHVVAGLERSGYISRQRNVSDARSQNIVLTEQGAAAIGEAHSDRICFLRSCLNGVSAVELATVAKVLSRIRDNANSNIAA